ncbi:SH3 domain-binding glutamic acid-rich-like protein 2 [Parasteatoda tepidariorum]|uniref:SH3 domain-binding glutamic acid-rich-like protein 2 n=1 Tax=Parasteatoda tepidariorum TaxID=114398 RepID=UPI001C71B753|nr:SH3 domain-binding glutamic acid-rich-like protein 2 [Parasteatoda tepidariorum]
MTIKVYISGICGSHEVRKHQQRVLFILQGLPIDLQIVDITEPGRDDDLVFMQEEAKKHDKKTQLPPQIFNDSKYCGDYADFELANDDDEIMRFLKLETSVPKSEEIKETVSQNGHTNNLENSEVNEEPSLNSVQENNISNDKDVSLNDLESNVTGENIETSVDDDNKKDIQEVNVSEKKNVEGSEEESEEETV